MVADFGEPDPTSVGPRRDQQDVTLIHFACGGSGDGVIQSAAPLARAFRLNLAMTPGGRLGSINSPEASASHPKYGSSLIATKRRLDPSSLETARQNITAMNDGRQQSKPFIAYRSPGSCRSSSCCVAVCYSSTTQRQLHWHLVPP
jgi:hypothetical protein